MMSSLRFDYAFTSNDFKVLFFPNKSFCHFFKLFFLQVSVFFACVLYLYLLQTLFVVGYTVFTLSVHVSIHDPLDFS